MNRGETRDCWLLAPVFPFCTPTAFLFWFGADCFAQATASLGPCHPSQWEGGLGAGAGGIHAVAPDLSTAAWPKSGSCAGSHCLQLARGAWFVYRAPTHIYSAHTEQDALPGCGEGTNQTKSEDEKHDP